MPVVSVSQLNNYMKRYVDQNNNLSNLWVCGEISNYKLHYSGHMYMSLKDDYSTLRAVVFSGNAQKVKFPLKDGMRIIAFGKVSVYERDGSYQLYVEKIIPDGKGELYAAFEQLKSRLQSEGLFDKERKKALPVIPGKIGIVTSLSGAAIRDIVSVSKRRFPLSDLCIYPAKVQGIGAAESICNGIEYLDKNTCCDVIMIARGGGSIEDLWAFNEEKTAYAISACSKPVISAVGHETDYTIADFVADMRAPTPSAGAEIALPDAMDFMQFISDKINHMNYTVNRMLNSLRLKLSECSIRNMYIRETELCNHKEVQVSQLHDELNKKIKFICSEKLNGLSVLCASLESMNPLHVLKRGYCVITDADGEYVSAKKIKEDDEINVKFNGGKLNCTVRRVVYEK